MKESYGKGSAAHTGPDSPKKLYAPSVGYAAGHKRLNSAAVDRVVRAGYAKGS